MAKQDHVSKNTLESEVINTRLRRRNRLDRAFKWLGLGAVFSALLALLWLLISIVGTGYKAFYQHTVSIEIELAADTIDPENARDPDQLRRASYRNLVRNALLEKFPGVSQPSQQLELFRILSTTGAANVVRQTVYKNPSLVGQRQVFRLPVSDDVDQLLKGNIDAAASAAVRKVSDRQLDWINALQSDGTLKPRLKTNFFLHPDSGDPELAGIAGALVGSLMALFVAFIVCIPIGVGAGLYLEEFAPKNAFVSFVEININNLAAMPSIVYGLLGFAVFLNFFGMPRSAPLVAGLVLALMMMPIIIIATRSALQAVPESMVTSALSLGASPMQAVLHHKFPLAVPGILTGTIIGMAQALGETAPLLMIGMVAFVTDIPSNVTDPSTALPVQIFLWADAAERAWAENTSAAILVLLCFLIVMNGFAVFLRSRLDKRR